ncbi:hypothetical protein [Amycolatopsis keratiniphila]|uniref:hypothetical protein n=1 Tax=Amycolatopsis keratiniphila TaxID=129921 RepID=UPI0011815E96|nr:hypothetical protein [Amycolatopsis keratiniphila]
MAALIGLLLRVLIRPRPSFADTKGSMVPAKTRTSRLALAVSVCVLGALALFVAVDRGPSTGAETVSAQPLASQEKSILHRAEQILLRACMADSGYTYVMVEEEPMSFLRRFPYVVDDLSWAREHGFGNDDREEVRMRAENDPNKRYFSGLSAADKAKALAAVNGERPVGLIATSPAGVEITRSDRGCTSQLEKKLYRELQTWFRAKTVTDGLHVPRRQQVSVDPRFRTALSDWARCMAERGYSFAAPARVHEAFRVRGPEEISAAIAEATCARSTGFASVARDLDAHYEALQGQQYGREIADRLRLERAALPLARAVVESRSR